MGELVNLKRARKARARSEAEQRAAANRALHGRTKAERAQKQLETQRAGKELDDKKLE